MVFSELIQRAVICQVLMLICFILKVRAVELKVIIVCGRFCSIKICKHACRSNSLLPFSLTGPKPEHLVSFVEKKIHLSFSSLAGSGEFISLETEVHMVSAKFSLTRLSFRSDIMAEYKKQQV